MPANIPSVFNSRRCAGDMQKLRAKHLSSLIVAMVPPRIATRTSGSATAYQAALANEDDDGIHEDTDPEQQQAQQRQAAGTAPGQHTSDGSQPLKFTGRNPYTAGRTPFTALPTAPVGQIPDTGAARAAISTRQKAAVADSRNAGEQPAAGLAQGVVGVDGLNDGQRTAVHRWPIRMPMRVQHPFRKSSASIVKCEASQSEPC